MIDVKKIPIIGYFWEKSFLHYAWSGAFISVLNIFLLWFFIDIVHISTVVSSVMVVGGTFLLRYVLFKTFHVV